MTIPVHSERTGPRTAQPLVWNTVLWKKHVFLAGSSWAQITESQKIIELPMRLWIQVFEKLIFHSSPKKQLYTRNNSMPGNHVIDFHCLQGKNKHQMINEPSHFDKFSASGSSSTPNHRLSNGFAASGHVDIKSRCIFLSCNKSGLIKVDEAKHEVHILNQLAKSLALIESIES